MDNFVFSSQLEVGIIEYRLISLMKMMEELGVFVFYPALIFNESYWLNEVPKRKRIFETQQQDWIGAHPINQTYFFYDPYFLEIVRSLKVSLFTYSKVDLATLIDILKTKNKFAITDYAEFGDAVKSPIKFVNDAFNSIYGDINSNNPNSETFGKILAIKIFAQLVKHNSFELLVISGNKNQELIVTLINSLKIIEETKNLRLLDKLQVSLLVFDSSENLHTVSKSINEAISADFKLKIVDIFDPYSFNLKNDYDYIILDNVLSKVPSNIIKKFDKTYFCLNGRLVTKERGSIEKSIEFVSKLQSPIKDYSDIKAEETDQLDFELSWNNLNDEQLINLIEQVYTVTENKIYKFSLIILKCIVESIKHTKNEGKVYLLDLTDGIMGQYMIGLKLQENCFRTSLSLDLYKKFLESFEDLNISIKSDAFQNVILEELFDDKSKYTDSNRILELIKSKPALSKELFDIDNFSIKNDLIKIESKYKLNTFMKDKGLGSFGIENKLFESGFEKFKKDLRNIEILNSLLDDINSFKLPQTKSYSKGIIIYLIPKFLNELTDLKSKFISKTESDPVNSDFNSLLDKYGLIRSKIYLFLNKYWNEMKDTDMMEVRDEFIEISVYKEKLEKKSK